jgi:hypothetical protein
VIRVEYVDSFIQQFVLDNDRNRAIDVQILTRHISRAGVPRFRSASQQWLYVLHSMRSDLVLVVVSDVD